MKKLFIFFAVLTCFVLAILTSNCGYRLSGFGDQIPDHIKTVIIPFFENKTTRYQAEEYITYAVKEEFIKRSNLKIVDKEAQADAILEGTIMRFDVTPVSYADDASANVYTITITVSARLIDLKTNELIFEGEGISYSDTYNFDTYGDDLSNLEAQEDFFSQETDTLIKLTEEFAASLVTTIMENF